MDDNRIWCLVLEVPVLMQEGFTTDRNLYHSEIESLIRANLEIVYQIQPTGEGIFVISGPQFQYTYYVAVNENHFAWTYTVTKTGKKISGPDEIPLDKPTATIRDGDVVYAVVWYGTKEKPAWVE